MNIDLGAVLVGVFSSFIATSLYLTVLLGIRPRIRISDCIGVSQSLDGKKEFTIKVINTSWWPVLNIQAKLFLVNPSGVQGGSIQEHREVKLKIDQIPRLGRYNRRPENEDYAWRFLTYENLSAKWTDDVQHHVVFQLVAYHSLSGFCRVFVQRYHKRGAVFRDGDFRFGRFLDVG